MKKLIILLIVTIYSNIYSQPFQYWNSRYNSGYINNFSTSVYIKVDAMGNIYVTGVSVGSSTSEDIVTIKYNSAGNQIWASRYNGFGNSKENPCALNFDNNGNIYVAGTSTSDSGNSSYVVIKYNSDGISQWVSKYSGAMNVSVAKAMDIDNNGNLYVTGQSKEVNNYSNIVTVKYNSSGILQWMRNYAGLNNWYESGECIKSDNSGNIYVGGYIYQSDFDYALIKYNSAGVQQWIAKLNGSAAGADKISSIVLDSTGNNVYVTGTMSSDNTYLDYGTVKYNSSGMRQWTAIYSGTQIHEDNTPSSIMLDPSGNIIVTGSGVGNNYGNYSTVKYNSSGVQQWASVFTSGIFNGATVYGMVVDNQGNSYITGMNSTDSTYYDYYTMKYNANGNQEWAIRYNGIGNYLDAGKAIALDNAGNIIVSGYSDAISSPYNTDITTIKYSQQVGIEPISSVLAEKYRLIQNYPNPFNPETSIEFSLPQSGFVKLTVFSMDGREVASLVNQNLSAGNYRYNFIAENFPSGIYFYRIEANNFVDTKRMVLVK
jgi:uncharacterized delta-60 repeat protein